jgi:hypothetical protein
MMHAWVWPLFCQLRDRNLPVSFSYALLPNAVNFIHGEVARYQLSGEDFRTHYIVGIRADFRPFPFSNIEIVQNKISAKGNAFFMPHFPQPGLLPRRSDRCEVENICFSGQIENFGVDVPQFERDLAKLECHFVYRKVGEWQDMEDIDVLLGFRALSKERYKTKPPTKLFNAWLAEIPFIGGYDSACEQVGTPGSDYIQVSTYEELIRMIARLKRDPEYYRKMVEAGRKRGSEYTEDKITDRWITFLDNQVLPSFLAWRAEDRSERLMGWIRGMAFEYWEKIFRGYRRAKMWK